MEDTEDKADDGGEEKDPEGMVELRARPISRHTAVFMDLLADKTELYDVEDDPGDEEEQIELFSSDREKTTRSIWKGAISQLGVRRVIRRGQIDSPLTTGLTMIAVA